MILPALTVLPPALLVLASIASWLPVRTAAWSVAACGGVGIMLSLIAAVGRLSTATTALPAGPPGTPMHLALDALSAYTLLLLFIATTGIAAWQAVAPSGVTCRPVRRIAIAAAGFAATVLAADATLLTIGMTVALAAIWFDAPRGRLAAFMIPLLLLAAVILLTPAGFNPRFDAIRTAPLALMHPTAAVLLVLVASGLLICLPEVALRDMADVLVIGLLLPSSGYIVLRLAVELPSSGTDMLWGFLLIILGGSIAVLSGWRAVTQPRIDSIVRAAARSGAGLQQLGAGLAIVARVADLPSAMAYALESSLILMLGGLASTAVILATHALAHGAGSHRLSRLGGLLHLMPRASTALCAGLAAGMALPPGLGFAALWLLLRGLIAAPRMESLLPQLIMAGSAGAVALSCTLVLAASLRLVGVAVLSRPRTPRGATAQDIPASASSPLLALAALPALIGLLPGSALSALAGPVIANLSGVGLAGGDGPFGNGPGYLALPTVLLFGFVAGPIVAIRRMAGSTRRVVNPWSGGGEPPYSLPFGDPLAQAGGHGFAPQLPTLTNWHWPVLPAMPSWRVSPAQAGLWLILTAVAACLIILILTGSNR